MVDMIEARKRAKARSSQRSGADRNTATQTAPDPNQPNLVDDPASVKEPAPPQAKPVLRSETAETPSEPRVYFPVTESQKPAVESTGRSPHVPPVQAAVFAEDQVDFLQRLFSEDEDDDELERAEEIAEEELEMLVFQLGSEKYGMDIQQIAEIIRFVEPTEVPNTVPYLDGIISLRGRMVPVINGRKRLGHEPKIPDKKTRIIVLNDNNEFHGILVDSASQVVKLPKKDIEPTPSVVIGVDAEYINGVCEYKNNLVILLNLERFLQFL